MYIYAFIWVYTYIHTYIQSWCDPQEFEAAMWASIPTLDSITITVTFIIIIIAWISIPDFELNWFLNQSPFGISDLVMHFHPAIFPCFWFGCTTSDPNRSNMVNFLFRSVSFRSKITWSSLGCDSGDIWWNHWTPVDNWDLLDRLDYRGQVGIRNWFFWGGLGGEENSDNQRALY